MAEKLVRDLIPYVILRNGDPLPPMRVLKSGRSLENIEFLLAKLDEEVAELKAALRANHRFLTGNDPDAYIEAAKQVVVEAADVAEVLFSLARQEDVERLRLNKRAERGGFDNLVVLNFK